MSVLAKRYATALQEAAGPAAAKGVLENLEAMDAAILRDPTLKKVLENPGITMAEKDSLLAAIQKKAGVMPIVIRLLSLLAEKHRVALLSDIVAAFQALIDAETGLVRARLTTAKPLARPQTDHIRQKLAETLGHPVAIEAKVRADLIAGAQLQLGSTIYDGSVSGALKALKSSLVKGSA